MTFIFAAPARKTK